MQCSVKGRFFASVIFSQINKNPSITTKFLIHLFPKFLLTSKRVVSLNACYSSVCFRPDFCTCCHTWGGCWGQRRRTPAASLIRGWWWRCCRTEPSATPAHSKTWERSRRSWSRGATDKSFQSEPSKQTGSCLRVSLLTMVLQRGSPSGSVRVPPYTTGSWSGLMCLRSASCQLPANSQAIWRTNQ